MTEFRRLLESSPTPATRELLRSGLGDRPRREVTERAALALGLTVATMSSTAGAAAAAVGAATTATSAVSTAGTSLGALSLVKWLAVGMTAGVVASGGAAVVHEVARGQVAVPKSTHVTEVAPAGRNTPQNALNPRNNAVSAPKGAAVAQQAAAEPNVASAPPLGAPGPMPPAGTAGTTVSDSAPLRPPSTQTPIPAVSSGALAREVAQIDAARSALAAGDTARALAELERYERMRQTPTFVREAELLRIEAFSARGEHARAAELARRYITRFPNDAHVAKLRQEFSP
jgi:hypothetical protein